MKGNSVAYKGNPSNPQWGRSELSNFMVKNMKYSYQEVTGFEIWYMRKLVTQHVESKKKARDKKKQLVLDI